MELTSNSDHSSDEKLSGVSEKRSFNPQKKIAGAVFLGFNEVTSLSLFSFLRGD